MNEDINRVGHVAIQKALLKIKEAAHEWTASFPLKGPAGNYDREVAEQIYQLCVEYDVKKSLSENAPKSEAGMGVSLDQEFNCPPKSTEDSSSSPALQNEQEEERREQCIDCQQFVSDWVESQEPPWGRICRPCETKRSKEYFKELGGQP